MHQHMTVYAFVWCDGILLCVSRNKLVSILFTTHQWWSPHAHNQCSRVTLCLLFPFALSFFIPIFLRSLRIVPICLSPHFSWSSCHHRRPSVRYCYTRFIFITVCKTRCCIPLHSLCCFSICSCWPHITTSHGPVSCLQLVFHQHAHHDNFDTLSHSFAHVSVCRRAKKGKSKPLDGHSTLPYPNLLPEWHIASPERHPQWNIIQSAANLEEDFTICYGGGMWWRGITVSSQQYWEREQKEKKRRFHTLWMQNGRKTSEFYTTMHDCRHLLAFFRFLPCCSDVQTCILSRFVSFVVFCSFFFFSLPLYAPSMNTNSSYASFILSYTELHLCFSFWFFSNLLDSVPSLTSFSFPSSYNCFFYYVSCPLFILWSPP